MCSVRFRRNLHIRRYFGDFARDSSFSVDSFPHRFVLYVYANRIEVKSGVFIGRHRRTAKLNFGEIEREFEEIEGILEESTMGRKKKSKNSNDSKNGDVSRRQESTKVDETPGSWILRVNDTFRNVAIGDKKVAALIEEEKNRRDDRGNPVHKKAEDAWYRAYARWDDNKQELATIKKWLTEHVGVRDLTAEEIQERFPSYYKIVHDFMHIEKKPRLTTKKIATIINDRLKAEREMERQRQLKLYGIDIDHITKPRDPKWEPPLDVDGPWYYFKRDKGYLADKGCMYAGLVFVIIMAIVAYALLFTVLMPALQKWHDEKESAASQSAGSMTTKMETTTKGYDGLIFKPIEQCGDISNKCLFAYGPNKDSCKKSRCGNFSYTAVKRNDIVLADNKIAYNFSVSMTDFDGSSTPMADGKKVCEMDNGKPGVCSEKRECSEKYGGSVPDEWIDIGKMEPITGNNSCWDDKSMTILHDEAERMNEACKDFQRYCKKESLKIHAVVKLKHRKCSDTAKEPCKDLPLCLEVCGNCTDTDFGRMELVNCGGASNLTQPDGGCILRCIEKEAMTVTKLVLAETGFKCEKDGKPGYCFLGECIPVK